jgi:hemerythrin-like domain-containing protein
MLEAAEAYASGAEDAGRRWARAARDYVALLGAHINKEINVLFVMAERVLTSEEQDQLARDFEKIEDEKMGAGTHERLHAMMDKLLAGLGRK